jgi:hypothetical protein
LDLELLNLGIRNTGRYFSKENELLMIENLIKKIG